MAACSVSENITTGLRASLPAGAINVPEMAVIISGCSLWTKRVSFAVRKKNSRARVEKFVPQ